MTRLAKTRIGKKKQEGEIYEIYLQPEWKRMGLGRRLFDAAREGLAGSGRKGLVLWALAENANARAFYERIGGLVVAEGERNYHDRKVLMVAYAWE